MIKPPRRLPWRAFAHACSFLVLSGCQTLIKESADGDWVGITTGSKLHLERRIEIPLGRTRVFFRHGALTNTPASYQPSCALEVRRLDDTATQSVAPATFSISRVENYWAEVAALPREIRFQLTDHGTDGNAMIRTGYHFWLDNPADPNVMRITCLGALNEPAYAYPPTLDEIRAALGAWMRLELTAL